MLRPMLDRFKSLFEEDQPASQDQALVLSGGGARAAYQSGVLAYIAEAFPETNFSIQLGVSAGAINMAHLANYTGTFREATERLIEIWEDLQVEDVFEPESSVALVRRLIRRARLSPLEVNGPHQALLNTDPLRRFLQAELQTEEGELAGIHQNLERGRLRACALSATNYATGQTITWVQGRNITPWERPTRKSHETQLTVEHIMASTSLPLVFPAIQIGDAWYGDGGIRLSAPLSPVIHLGAHRILVISTRYHRSRAEADDPATVGYPPAAQIIGIMLNAVFLDVLDQDARKLERINQLLLSLPPRKWNGLRPIEFLVLRPSKDLGRMASEYTLTVGGALGWMTRWLGTEETKSPDWLSMLLFDREYVSRLIELGREDARRQHDVLAAFFSSELAVYSRKELIY